MFLRNSLEIVDFERPRAEAIWVMDDFDGLNSYMLTLLSQLNCLLQHLSGLVSSTDTLRCGTSFENRPRFENSGKIP